MYGCCRPAKHLTTVWNSLSSMYLSGPNSIQLSISSGALAVASVQPFVVDFACELTPASDDLAQDP